MNDYPIRLMQAMGWDFTMFVKSRIQQDFTPYQIALLIKDLLHGKDAHIEDILACVQHVRQTRTN